METILFYVLIVLVSMLPVGAALLGLYLGTRKKKTASKYKKPRCG